MTRLPGVLMRIDSDSNKSSKKNSFGAYAEMESSSSDNDSLRMLDDTDLIENEDELGWQDAESSRPFDHADGTSTLCHACQNFFSGTKQEEVCTKHLRLFSSLQHAAERGCHLCALIYHKINRETRNHSPCEVLRLSFRLYENYGGFLILWYEFCRRSKRAKYGDVVWGIKQIHLVPSEYFRGQAGISHKLTLDTGSDENRHLARQWLRHCIAHHQLCNRPKTKQNWMPTRLIDVGSIQPTNEAVRLVNSASIPSDSEYITLSHCWGRKPIISLRQANIEQLKAGIASKDLSKTFQDAIIVTRWFHCRYLWIDALCIIQGSVEDWQRESVQMHHVYRNALFNIAATGAKDSSGGLFFDRDPLLFKVGVVSASWSGPLRKGSFHFYTDDIWSHGVNNAPLSKRAWVVQERILSRRNLHFGAQSLFFECHELEANETLAEGLPPAVFDWRWANRFKNIQFAFEDQTVQTTSTEPDPLLRNWHKLVSAYMICDLTNLSDKAIAISGLAQEFQCNNHDTYLAGLWERHLSEQLLWSVRLCRQKNGLPSMRPPTYRAPSWSWLSIDADLTNPITFDPILIQILDVRIQLVDRDNPTGPIRNGTLTVKGQLQPASLQIGSKPEFYARAKHFLNDRDSEEPKYLVYVNFDEAAIKPREVFYIPVQFWAEKTITGLLLVPTREREMQFTRAGTFELEGAPECHQMLRKKDDRTKIFTIV